MDTGETKPDEIQNSEEQTFEEPKYFGQINPDKAKSEDYRSLYRYQKIDDLADRVIELEREKASNDEKYKRAIFVPKADDAEGVAAFAKALGVPDDPAEYDLPFNSEEILPVKQAMKSAQLTKTQAKLVGRALLQLTQSSVEKLKANRQARIDGFDGSLAALHTELQADVDRKNAAESDRKIFTSFLAETGLKEALERNGMAWNAEFAKAVAAWARSHAGQKAISSTPSASTRAPEAPPNPYGEEFNTRYGIKK